MTTLEILQKARAILAVSWGQGDYYHNGRFCALGAIRKAAGGSIYEKERLVTTPDDTETRINLSMAISEVVRAANKPVLLIHEWNDTATHDEVLKAFDKAIEELTP